MQTVPVNSTKSIDTSEHNKTKRESEKGPLTIDIPCPPEQWFPVNVTPAPELTAMQSSWFFTVLPVQARCYPGTCVQEQEDAPPRNCQRRLVPDVEPVGVGAGGLARARGVRCVAEGYIQVIADQFLAGHRGTDLVYSTYTT